jgi:hypothetical protein
MAAGIRASGSGAQICLDLLDSFLAERFRGRLALFRGGAVCGHQGDKRGYAQRADNRHPGFPAAGSME